jgi:ubiquinone/menaquinone biosynthesis C-methylase UbiE
MMITLVCPTCRQILHATENAISCPVCGIIIPQTLGIPDLRGARAITSEVDAHLGAKMTALYRDLDFAGLLKLRLSNSHASADLIGYELGYHLAGVERGRRMVKMFQAQLQKYAGAVSYRIALDIGCGTGSGLLALAQSFDLVVGVDPSLLDLLVALKTVESAGARNVLLVQAYGELLPFADGTFDHISILNVLEHILNLDGILAECRRVLRSGGTLAADSRNRYDLFLPEPHVKIRWVGLLPRSWAKRYVRWRKHVGYEGTYLHSFNELAEALGRHFGRCCRVVFPLVSAYGGPDWCDRGLAGIQRLPLVAGLLLWVFPSHLVLAWRPPEGNTR